MLFTDKIIIKTAAINNTFNSLDYGAAKTIKAYIENNSKIQYNANGQAYTPSFLIFLPANTVIAMQDVIEIVKIHGADPMGDEVGDKQIKQVKRVGGSSISHLEVYV